MVLVTVLSLVLGAQGSAGVDVWRQDLRLDKLVHVLSSKGMLFTCDPCVADRKVHVFVRNQSPIAIADKVAQTLGLQFHRVDGNWRFDQDLDYERVIDGHEREVRRETTRALARLIADLRATPPRLTEHRTKYDSKWTAKLARDEIGDLSPRDQALYFSLASSRDDVLWMLANLNAEERDAILAGHAVIGAVPKQPGFVPIPGIPDDYRYFKGSKKGYLILQFDKNTGQIRICPVKVPLLDSPPGASVSEFPVLAVGGGVFSLDQEWTTLGKWARHWGDNSLGIWRLLMDKPWNPGGRGHGPAAEWLAKISGRPTIVEASPMRPDTVFDTFETAQLERNSYGWILAKPPGFWTLSSAGKLEGQLDRIPKPRADNPQLALDWICRVAITISDFFRQYLIGSEWLAIDRDGAGSYKCFPQFWLALTPYQKQKAMNSGLSQAEIEGQQVRLFVDAAARLAARGNVHGDLSGLFAKEGKAKFSVRYSSKWALRDKYSAAIYQSKEDLLTSRSSGNQGKPYCGFEYIVEFSSEEGAAKGDFSAYFPLR